MFISVHSGSIGIGIKKGEKSRAGEPVGAGCFWLLGAGAGKN